MVNYTHKGQKYRTLKVIFQQEKKTYNVIWASKNEVLRIGASGPTKIGSACGYHRVIKLKNYHTCY